MGFDVRVHRMTADQLHKIDEGDHIAVLSNSDDEVVLMYGPSKARDAARVMEHDYLIGHSPQREYDLWEQFLWEMQGVLVQVTCEGNENVSLISRREGAPNLGRAVEAE